ncbi:MAG: helix-turn-helix domain-containing protein [Pseudonocardia sp.]|nr:helix-turn-helix domain-containing protein [Pseudonocardia sp.]
MVRAAATLARADASEAPLVSCWISPTWSINLAVGDHPDWPLSAETTSGAEGLASILVARRHRYDKVSVCGYLVDVYCLGVKNVLGPKIMDELELRGVRRRYFSAYQSDPLEAPIELAREVVFGAVAYARSLGFEPHPDFAATQAHLGPWSGPSTITFGNQGKPFYISGPNDNPQSIIQTLERTAGSGNYNYLVGVG